MPIYKNIYTMFKYNGESLTTYEPCDSWETIPKGLAALGSVQIPNVHILANLEPFRYGSPDFIQKCVKAMQQVQGRKGIASLSAGLLLGLAIQCRQNGAAAAGNGSRLDLVLSLGTLRMELPSQPGR